MADVALIDAAGIYNVFITTAEAAQSLILNDAGATVADTGTLTVAGALTLTAGTFGLDSGGVVSGGTLSATGGSFAWNGGTLDGVTYQGPLDLTAAAASLSVANGLTATGAGGTGPGVINADGAATSLTFLGTQTLDNVTINAGNLSGPGGTAVNFADLTLGAHATINQLGGLGTSSQSIYSGTSLTNNGTIQASQVNAGATIVTTALINNGLISAALPGATFSLQTTNLTNNGTILGLGGIGVSATTLTNNGVFTDAGGVSATTFTNNGTFNDNGGFATTPAGFINNGIFNLGGSNTYLAIIGTFSGAPAAGASATGTINMTGSGQLRLMGSQSIQAGTINLAGTGEQIISGTGQTSGVSQLILGPQATIDHTAGTTQITGGSIVVNGAINASGAGGVLTINPQSVVDNGSINVTGGDHVILGAPVTGTGQITIGSGGIAEFSSSSASTDTVVFADASTATLRVDLGNASGFKSVIQGFTNGNTIDLTGITATGATWSNGVLTVAEGGATPVTLALAGNYAGAVFHFAVDGILATPPGFGFGIYPGTNITVTGAGAPPPRVYGGAGATLSAAEGGAVTSPVASFTDSNTADTASQLTATITWGDGSTSAGVVTGSAGVFNVAAPAGHIYADEGSYATGIAITNSADAVTTTLAGSVTATEADVLTAGAAPAIAATTGTAFSGTLATFTDSFTANSASDFTATVNWGDGTSSAGVITDVNGAISVAGNHTYSAAGNDVVSVMLHDAHGTASAAATGTAAVAAAPAVSATGLTVLSVSDASLGPAGVFTTSNVNSATAAAATIPGSISASSSATASDAVHASSVSTNQTVTAAWTSASAGTATFQDSWSSTNVQLGVNNAGQAYGMQAGPGYANATFDVTLAAPGTFNIAWTALLSGTGPTASWGTVTGPVGESGFLNMVVSIDGGAALQVSPAANVVPTGSFSGALTAGAHTIKIMDWSNYSGVEFTSTGALTETLNLAINQGAAPPPRVYGGQGATLSVTEGSPATGAVASFTDSNTADTASLFTATIAWGDGSASAGTVTGSNGAFSIAGTHGYAAEGSYVTRVTVTSSADNVPTVLAGSAAAGEADVLTTKTAPAISAIAGQVVSATIATFADSYAGNAASDFTATITWGDGTSSAGTVTAVAGVISVSGGHSYAAAGTDAVSVTLKDADGTATATATGTASVASPYAGSGSALAVAEGKAFTGTVANFSDANTTEAASAFTAVIAWGDGTTSAGTVTGSNGAFAVTGSHVYAAEGSHPVTTTITHVADSAQLALTGSATAAEADVFTVATAPAIAATAGTVFTGTVATFTDSYAGNTAGDLGATILWGDGSSSAGSVTDTNGAITVSGTHTYASAGSDIVAVTLTDLDGTATATASGTASVAAAGGGGGTFILTTGDDTFIGGPGNDVVIAATNTLTSGDVIDGKGGSNTLRLAGGGVFDLSQPDLLANIQVVAAQDGAGAAAQLVTLREGTHFRVNVGAAPAGGSGAGITIVGGDNTDVINLGTGNDTVVLGIGETVNAGGGGHATYKVTADTIAAVTINGGGAGSNTLWVTGGGDVVMGTRIKGIDTVQLVARTHFVANATAGLHIAGSAAGGDTIALGAKSQSVVSGGSNELIQVTAANAGAKVTGLGSNSTLEITTGGTAVLNAATSVGTVKLDAATNLTLSGISFVTAIGSSGHDTITAGATFQTLTGGGGGDTLVGFAGGHDTFRDQAAGLRGDVIRNFLASERIDVTDLAFPGATVKAAASGANTLVTLTSGATVTHVTLAGSYSAAGFNLASDGHTGTLLTYS